MWDGGTIGERARADFAKFNTEQISAIVAYLCWKLEAAETLLESHRIARQRCLPPLAHG